MIYIIKTVMEKREKLRVIRPYTPEETETVICDVPIKYYVCDECGKETSYPLIECLCCRKHSCCGPKTMFEFEVGDRGDEDTYNGTIPESDDYRTAWFYLCPECSKNKSDTEKIRKLFDLIEALSRIEKMKYRITNGIIDEIERLKKI